MRAGEPQGGLMPAREQGGPYVTGRPVTPATFALELAMTEAGVSRNARRFVAEGGGWKDWLEMWPRDGRPGIEPCLVDPARPMSEARDAAWLAGFTFSYDPARYTRPTPARQTVGMRLRAFVDGLRTIGVEPVPYRPCPPSARFHWPEEADEAPDDEEDG